MCVVFFNTLHDNDYAVTIGVLLPGLQHVLSLPQLSVKCVASALLCKYRTVLVNEEMLFSEKRVLGFNVECDFYNQDFCILCNINKLFIYILSFSAMISNAQIRG